jgi:CheY-like chemotaxis protein
MTTQAALADLNSRLLADLSTRLVSKAKPTDLLGGILDAGIRITGAEMGNIQLHNVRTGQLEIVVQRGFEAEFLDFFARVENDHGACGTAMSSGRRTIVDDITESPIFAGTDALGVLFRAGVRAVQSTPLWSPSGELVGMLSTHYRRAYSPEESDLQLLDILAGLCHQLTIQLPCVPAPVEILPAALPSTPAALTRRVLVVGGNNDGREMLRVVLTLDGHEVHEAPDGPTGIELAVAVRPDIALVNVALPSVDGYEVAREIRTAKGGKSVLLIALTGYGQVDDRLRALDAGFDALLTEPVSRESLTAAVAEASSRSPVRPQIQP